MTDLSALKELRERVMASNGIPDDQVAGQPLRELDCYIWALVDESEEWKLEEARSPTGTYLQGTAPPLNGTMRYRSFGQYQEHKGERVFLCAKAHSSIPPYTSSLEAALELVAKVLPGYSPGVVQNLHHKHWVGSLSVACPAVKSDPRTTDLIATFNDVGPTPALALLAALLSAKIAQADQQQGGEGK